MTENELKEFLDFKAALYESKAFIEHDPISIPHQFSKKEDIEISALLVATIAWGNRKSIIKSGENLLNIMKHAPHEFVMNYNSKQAKKLKFVHRTFNTNDLDFFFRALKTIYENKGLENTFTKHKSIDGVKGRIVNFRTEFLKTPHHVRNIYTERSRSAKHISDPLSNSAAKRLNMFLRWMVRSPKKGVDFGIWKSIPTSELFLPLDVHTGNIARKLELLNRKQNDWKALEELMHTLQHFDKKDPVKYDFALFGLGAFEKF